jgi:hypothetical protein
MKRIIKFFLIIICFIIIILIITNPSLKNFKEFIPSQGYVDCKNVSKEKNFIIFSIFSFKGDIVSEYTSGTITKKVTYIGFFKNFIFLNRTSFY